MCLFVELFLENDNKLQLHLFMHSQTHTHMYTLKSYFLICIVCVCRMTELFDLVQMIQRIAYDQTKTIHSV